MSSRQAKTNDSPSCTSKTAARAKKATPFSCATRKERQSIGTLHWRNQDDKYYVVENVGNKLFIKTNEGAPNWKVVLVDLKNPSEKNWTTVLPEKPEPLEDVGAAGGKIFARYLKDVTARVYVYDLSGNLENEIALPGLGTAGGFGGKKTTSSSSTLSIR